MNALSGQPSTSGGGSGGSLWATCQEFTGRGKIEARGGIGSTYGGGGAGGRITRPNRCTWGQGGSGSNVEHGGPGVIYLYGKSPEVKNLRIDNKGLKPLPSLSGDYNLFIYSGAVAYLNPPSDNFLYDFTLIEIYGGGQLVFPRAGTEVRVDTIYGDDTGYIHVPPFNTLNMTGTSEYKRINVTWAPFVYENATFVLPNGTVEILQKTSRLLLDSNLGDESDGWTIEVAKEYGPVYREGVVTIEGDGTFEARSLILKAESLVVDPLGKLTLDGKGYLAGTGPGSGSGSADGSGAGYGGNGGNGRVTMATGLPYGDYTNPRVFGSGGGLGGSAGSGGGVLSLEIVDALVVEGTITVSGSAGAASNSGGGSGGGIMIRTRALEGSGVIAVNGGAGSGNGGGGGGGRMAVYWQDREWWYGGLTAFGGSSPQGGNGGAGSVYLEDTQHGVKNRTLIFDNNNLGPNTLEISDFSSPYTNGGRAWLQPIGQEYELEEVHILRRAHVALHPNITRPHGLKAYNFVGDRTGVLHVGPNQIVIGSTELANSEGNYRFHSLTVADGGEVTSTSDVKNNSLTLDIDDVTVQGGGILHMVRMRIFAGNFTVDDQGHVRVVPLVQVSQVQEGPRVQGMVGMEDTERIKTRVGVAYGHVYEPEHFGCQGGGTGD
ncbi:hypothetical protein OS493_002927 [Desmophyllum pertusum]|uniref:Uncharacterized protein n=1 Tax=Desmophyllum pertusum TaxID=174260 RepID=A0A9W9YGL8_9CNID|nr:hypothetical protein OS493_002927 [Desmophyllum pertusum]